MLFSRRHPIRDDELNAYVDGELATGARARIDAHLEGCAVCRETVSSLRSLRGALGALPREERRRSFVVRESDVLPRATPWPANGYPLAARLLSGVTVLAVLTFAALVSLDAAGGRSKDSGSPSALRSLPGDSAATRNDLGAAHTPAVQYQSEQPPTSPAAGAAPDATTSNTERPTAGPTGPNVEQPLPLATAPAFEDNPSREATPPTVAGGEEPTAQPPSGPLPTAVGGEQAPSAGSTQALEGGSATDQTPPPSFDAGTNGQGVIPPGAPATSQKRAGVEADQAGAGESSDTGLRAGEAAAAAIALMAGGSLAFVWWRRRTL